LPCPATSVREQHRLVPPSQPAFNNVLQNSSSLCPVPSHNSKGMAGCVSVHLEADLPVRCLARLT
jgi:hypothetical protein